MAVVKLKYIELRKSTADTPLSVYDGSVLAALLHTGSNLKNLDTATILSIFFEQALLCDYLLEATPNNEVLQEYRAAITKTYATYRNSILQSFSEKEAFQTTYMLSLEQVGLITDYIKNKTYSNAQSMVDLLKVLGERGYAYTSYMPNFFVPYFEQDLHVGAADTEDITTNPVLLRPKLVISKNNREEEVVQLFPVSFTYRTNRSKNTNPFNGQNKVYRYLSDMCFTGKPWQMVVDLVQSFSLEPKGTTESYRTLPGLLQNYLRGEYIPGTLDFTKQKQTLITLFNHILKHNTLSTNDTKIEELSRLMATIFADDRLGYLEMPEPTLAATAQWNAYADLACFTRYGMEAQGDTDTGESSDTSDDADQNEQSEPQGDDDSTSDASTDTDDTSDDDPDDFGDNFEDDSGNDETTDTDTTPEAEPEDVNPLITIIDSESFDEYLLRGLLERTMLRIFANPPSTMSVDQLNLVKYWYIQWFPLVSVETTKLVLGDLLTME